ncbi:hypothetical protein, partial [Amycolatopsis mediterranei]|uniref:hypothetical protein n=1 Tax=Amycolatopsis mediterranei TaxID=33910 RepID=UPI00332A99F1
RVGVLVVWISEVCCCHLRLTAAWAGADNALGLLAIEHHNAAGNRANVVKVDATQGARPGNERQPIGPGRR